MQINITLDVNSVPPTAITFAPAVGVSTVSSNHYSVATGTLPAGFVLGTLTVQPSGWQGNVAAAVTPNGAVTISGSGGTYTLAVGTNGLPVAQGYNIAVATTR